MPAGADAFLAGFTARLRFCSSLGTCTSQARPTACTHNSHFLGWAVRVVCCNLCQQKGSHCGAPTSCCYACCPQPLPAKPKMAAPHLQALDDAIRDVNLVPLQAMTG
jgi:hypothetical protein